MSAAPLLEVEDLKTHFFLGTARPFGSGRRLLKAVDGVSFSIGAGEVLSLVGESGCGKSTVGRTLTRLETASGGTARLDGRDILPLSQSEFRPLRVGEKPRRGSCAYRRDAAAGRPRPQGDGTLSA